ncbi:conserved Plasmodium protein, unknown function [Plasmodium vinckei vinckei]|uniref:G-patch domain-containing protein n=1 Tax=Plasmodium vinckei vinckei TaxID=54757 RepID=A0A449BX68_PLAVN|nr:conserved Plasmodium protein, unknown function [Plasmodium vinckei vinckei]KEG03774.1 hypothetical protein YYE_01801 [Plasmodium vinckei vinckei]VEV58066.1 conserved Plasmodium protein, unknown function [Plasmodium vinckei vinckei]
MDYSSDDISFTDFDFEPQKKKKKKSHTQSNDKYNRFKNTDEEEYLKPVVFVSGGFLNSTNKKKNEEDNNLNFSSTDNDSSDYEEYDVFKHFTFDFNINSKNEADFIKNNLKKYHLTELKEQDKNFEQYGLGFKILRKMGYEDGIGNKIKTNIAPIELKKKHTSILEEQKKNKYFDDNDSDLDNYSNESYDMIFNPNINITTFWKKTFNYKKHCNFNKIKNEINARLKYTDTYTSSYIFNDNIDDDTENNGNTTMTTSLDNDTTCVQNIQQTSTKLNDHIKDMSFNYFTIIKKKKEAEIKFKNYKNSFNVNDIYKIHELLLKNILTYKYLLNIHTILSYPHLFNNHTFNEYIFQNMNHNIHQQSYNESSLSNDQNDAQPDPLNVDHCEKLINTYSNFQSDKINEEYDGHSQYFTQHENELHYTDTKNYETNLNELLISNYKLLCDKTYFNQKQKELTKHININTNYQNIEDLQYIYNLLNVKNIQIKKTNDPILLCDIYTLLFFIYENSKFLYLSTHVSKFFLEFLRIYFYNIHQKYIEPYEQKNDEDGENTKNDTIEYNTHNTGLTNNNIFHEQNEHNKISLNYSNDFPKYSQNDISYVIYIKKIILMGINEINKTEYHEIENEFNNIIYYNLIYPHIYKQNYYDVFDYINLFKDAFSNSYYKKILIFFINKNILLNIVETEHFDLDQNALKDIEVKLSILFEINKQFDINTHINNYYMNILAKYFKNSNICENYIILIKTVLKNNLYKKEIFELVVNKIIFELNKINFTDMEFTQHLNQIMVLHNCIDDNIFFFILKVYFFYNYAKYVCNEIRNINHMFNDQIQNTQNNENQTENPENQNCTNQQQNIELLTAKKKELYEKFKKVKDVFQNNIMKDESIKDIMFSILNVIKTYVVQDKIITFSVEKVLNYDTMNIYSDNNINYYFLYKDIKIPIPIYAVPQKNNTLYEINNNKNSIQKQNSKDISYQNYQFSKKKYVNIIKKLEDDANHYKNDQQYENINVKDYLQRYCLENDILFIQKNNRKINGNTVFSINNFSIYINNNIIYIYKDQQWKPTLLSDLLSTVSNSTMHK